MSNYKNPVTIQALEDQVKNFQETSTTLTEANKAEEEARKQYHLRRERASLLRDYQDVQGTLIKKLMDSTSTEQSEKIRNSYQKRMNTILNNLDKVDAALAGQVSLQVSGSRAAVIDQVDRLKDILSAAQKLQAENNQVLVPNEIHIPG